MKLPPFALKVLATAIILSSTAQSDPIAKWLGPWSPSFNPLEISIDFGGDASAFRSFGALGDAETLPDTSARAFSRASADSSTLGGGSASTGLAFNRSFMLSGSPEGWDVTLSGRLVGLLFTFSLPRIPQQLSLQVPRSSRVVHLCCGAQPRLAPISSYPSTMANPRMPSSPMEPTPSLASSGPARV
jgi:hypothetical protein